MQPKPQIKSQWIQYFITLCHERTFTQAAAVLGISRSTLLRNLQLLETHLQTHLLEIQGNTFHITDQGRLFQQEAMGVLHKMQQLHYQLRMQCYHPIEGLITLAWQSGVVLEFTPKLLTEFMQTYPTVSFHIECHPHAHELNEYLETGYFDLAITDYIPTIHALEVRVLKRSPLVIVSAPQPKRHWSRFSYVSAPLNPETGKRGLFWDDHKYPRQIVCESNSLDVVLKWCISGQAAALLPLFAVQNYLSQGALAIVADPPEISFREVYLCRTPKSQHKTAATALCEHLLNKISHIK
jgi:DNA-binding transcriptional LysR family regulator